ncbi:MAG: PCC domain-containing protein [Stackebrandtia sp.]
MHVIEINDGELMQTLTDRLADLGIKHGAIVSLIGAVDAFRISTMPADDATSDTVTDYALPAEMSGTGEVVDGTPHLHAVMAVEGDRALSGHLHSAQVGTWFARVYVLPTDS